MNANTTTKNNNRTNNNFAFFDIQLMIDSKSENNEMERKPFLAFFD